jgi:hypothetical protein
MRIKSIAEQVGAARREHQPDTVDRFTALQCHDTERQSCHDSHGDPEKPLCDVHSSQF